MPPHLPLELVQEILMGGGHRRGKTGRSTHRYRCAMSDGGRNIGEGLDLMRERQ